MRHYKKEQTPPHEPGTRQSKEEIRQKEAQQAQCRNNLNRDALWRVLLNTRSRHAWASIITFAEASLFALLTEFGDGRLRLQKLRP